MCPFCRRNAPILYRGLVSYCTACGRKRLPFSAPSLNYAGKSSKVGGCVAGAVGWLVIAGGALVASLLGLFAQLAFAGYAGLIVGLPVALVALVVGVMFLMGGRRLEQSGEEKQRRAQERALYAFAANHQGRARPREAARALDMRPEEVDAILTELAKTYSDEVTVEIDDRGEIYYQFVELAPAAPDDFQARLRVAEAVARAGGPNVRIGDVSTPEEEERAEAEADAVGTDAAPRARR